MEIPEEQENKSYFLGLSELKIEIIPLSKGYFFKATLEEFRKKKQEELCSLLLHGTLLGQATGGAYIGLSDDEKILTLSRSIPYDVAYQGWEDLLEEFVNYACYWREQIESFPKE